MQIIKSSSIPLQDYNNLETTVCHNLSMAQHDVIVIDDPTRESKLIK